MLHIFNGMEWNVMYYRMLARTSGQLQGKVTENGKRKGHSKPKLREHG